MKTPDEPQIEEAEEITQTTSEFNLLANLIVDAHRETKDNFKLDLFPQQFGFGSKQSSSQRSEPTEENVICIDLGQESGDTKIKSLKREFEDFNQIDSEQKDETTGDDLLDMMDNF